MEEFFCVGFRVEPRVTNQTVVKELKERYKPFKTDSVDTPTYYWFFHDKETAEKARTGLIRCKAQDVWLE